MWIRRGNGMKEHRFNGRLAVVTCSRDRHYSLSLLQKYLERQTAKPDLWIVASEGEIPQLGAAIPLAHDHDDKPVIAGKFSHCRNLMRAIRLARDNDIDGVLIMEDDDWYRSDYIEFASELLNYGKVSSFRPCQYFHLTNGEQRLSPVYPFSQMGFQKDVFDCVLELANNATELIDGALWQRHKTVAHLVEDKTLRVLSLKGMYGTHGVTKYHHASSTVGNKVQGQCSDIFGALCGFIGADDAEAYRNIIENGALRAGPTVSQAAC